MTKREREAIKLACESLRGAVTLSKWNPTDTKLLVFKKAYIIPPLVYTSSVITMLIGRNNLTTSCINRIAGLERAIDVLWGKIGEIEC